MRGFPRFSHHRHTLRLRPHNETSYAALGFVLLVMAVIMLASGGFSSAATTGGGKYSVYAVVPGPKPTSPATITSPANGQTFQANPVNVTGTCPDKALVKVFSNGVLIGSALCGSNRQFTLEVTLLVGANALTALPYNANDEPGPISPTVNVTLNAPPGAPGFSTELVLQSINYYRGSQPGDEVTWPITIVGGVGPYAVSFDWGDGHSDLLTRTSDGPFTLTHTYTKPGGYLGSYPLIIRATDSAGHTAYLQLTTIVNPATGVNSKASPTKSTITYAFVWPLWVLLILMVISFWLGEKREKRALLKKIGAVA